MKIGDIINTPHGKAEVIGFERFSQKGFTAPMSNTYKGTERILCTLLPGHSWISNRTYALFSSEFKKHN